MAYWINEPAYKKTYERQIPFIIDDDSDLETLPGIDKYGVQQGDNTISNRPVAEGSTAFSIGSSKHFMLNSKNKWTEIKNTSGGSGGSDVDGRAATDQEIDDTIGSLDDL